MFNSYEKKDHIFEGAEYYTYFTFPNSKDTGFIDYTGIIKVKAKTIDHKGYVRFEILESKKLSDTLSYNINTYLNGYGSAFFDNKKDCIEHHDAMIIEFAKYKQTHIQKGLYTKILNKANVPSPDLIEISSINWYNNLSTEHQSYVKWIKNCWSDLAD